MKIHIKKADESIADIAEYYGINEATLRRINEIQDGECATGEELLILTPTRSYRAQVGDTLDRIALRFGIRKKDLLCRNPWLSDRGLQVGDDVTVKCDEQTNGMAVANGYFYPGCSDSALKRAMPFLTYISFCSAVSDRRGVSRVANDKREVALANEEKKIPLLRVYDRYCDRYKSGGDMTGFAEELIGAAVSGEYKGLVMDACPLCDSAEEFSAFMMILRKMMIGCDLILITEINENSPTEFSEYADGSIIYYPKFAIKNPPDFKGGERKILADFACESESAKAFIDLPSLAKIGEKYIPYAEALRLARDGNYTIEHNENTLLSHYRDRKQGECIFNSLSSIKALLDMTRELDYMGISFDIMRTPLSHLMMYNAMFKTSYFNSVRTREGCSRADGE